MVSAESQAAMDAARKAVMDFMSTNGHHDTTVYERVAPAVYHQTILRNEHEELVTVIDREVTQDHFHTSIQPLTSEETIEEQHHANILPVENRIFEHDDKEEIQRRLDSDRARFRDEIQRLDGEKTQTVTTSSAGEHIHHNVYEVIQPIVQKHTIEPHIIHSIVQIREKHHQAAQYHQAVSLPAVTLAEFLRQGGLLTGREQRYDSFEGEPRAYASSATTNAAAGVSQAASSDAAAATTAATSAVPLATSGASQMGASGVAGGAIDQPSQQPATQAIPQTQPQPPALSAAEAPPVAPEPPTPALIPVLAPLPARISSPPQAPERRSSMPPQVPTPSATAIEQAAARTPQPTSQQGGRWSLLPMHLARSAGEGQAGHPPARRGVPSVARARPGSGQGQGPGQAGQDAGRRGS